METSASFEARSAPSFYPAPREEVRLAGPGFHNRNAIAYGTVWAAERLAIAYLDAKAQGAIS